METLRAASGYQAINDADIARPGSSLLPAAVQFASRKCHSDKSIEVNGKQ